MIIKGKQAVVFDIEVFPNVFSCTTKNTETKEVKVFEISNRQNTIEEMVRLFKQPNLIFCGYNNIHYDNIVINFIIDNIATMPEDYQLVTKTLYSVSSCIISDNYDVYKRYKYSKFFESVDLLTMMFSSKLRVGLKEMQVTMHWDNVLEYDGDFSKPLPDTEIDKMLEYNLNDVLSTECLLNKQEEQIKLRLGIEEEFGVDVLSKDGMSIGTEILKIKYLEKTGKRWDEIKDLRSPADTIPLKDVIFPFIHYNTPVLQELLKEMKEQVVSPGRKGYEKHFLLGNLEITVGVGGIHSRNTPEMIVPNENQCLKDSDVNSLYPSLIISYGLVPKHLGKEFLEIYSQVRTERLEAKRNKEKIKNETLKLALNGATGNYQNQFSWLYDPVEVLKIRINGQLLLLMLAEKLMENGAILGQLNTDGILYLIDKQVDIDTILKSWEEETKLTLETEEFEAFYQFAINDYLAVGKGYSETKDESLLKYKGLFIEKTSLGKGMTPPIIAKAINKYLIDGTLPEVTVKESKDIHDFLTYTKVDKKFSIEYDGNLISRINRYYASTNGKFLFKCVRSYELAITDMVQIHTKNGTIIEAPKLETEIDGKYYDNPNVEKIIPIGTRNIPKEKRTDYEHLLKASGVTILNDLRGLKEFPTNINYRYYISECYKIIEPLRTEQLSLF